MHPSIADGRDLLSILLGNNIWSSIIMIKDLVIKLPELVSKTIDNPTCGEFRLGHNYNMAVWTSVPNYYVTKCIEIYPANGMVSSERTIVLTDNAFLLLEQAKFGNQQPVLMAWAFLHSLLKIRIGKHNHISLSWLTKFDPINSFVQTFEIDNPTVFVDSVVERIKRMEGILEIKENNPKKRIISEEDVSFESVLKTNINEINESIALCESSIDIDPSVSLFQTLITLYKKAIEYYSATGNSVHELYVKKMQGLIENQSEFSSMEEAKIIPNEDIKEPIPKVEPNIDLEKETNEIPKVTMDNENQDKEQDAEETDNLFKITDD